MNSWQPIGLRASLRITSDTVSVDEIEARLNFRPDKRYSKGEPVSLRQQGPLRKQNTCIFESKVGSNLLLEAHLEYLLTLIESHFQVLKSLQDSCSFEIIFGCSSDNGQLGLVITHEHLRRIAASPIDLILDIYAGSSD